MRFLPRFSLRFALLVLTIFLIVFGVGGKYWKDYQEHEVIVERLLNLGWSVEEEPVTLFGFVIGKRLTGLLGHNQIKPDYLQPFFELPRPQDLRRFALFMRDNDAKLKKQTLQRLQRSPRLERLQISWLFKETEYQHLANFKELRILDLGAATIPAGSLGFLEQLPRLEILRLNSSSLQWDELCRLSLPQLKILNVAGCTAREVRLTRDGWGRSPELEVLCFGNAAIQKVVCEPGAMPRLRALELGYQEADCDIDWAHFPETAPRLAHLSLPAAHFDAKLKKTLQRLPDLKVVLLGAKQERPRTFTYKNFSLSKVAVADDPAELAREAGNSLTRRLGYRDDFEPLKLQHEFEKQLSTPEFPFGSTPTWTSPHWHPNSAHLQGGFF